MTAAASPSRPALGLRLRLTLLYGVGLLLMLTLLGLLFRGALESVLQSNVHNVLEEEWGAVRAYLQFERGQPIWFYDRDDIEESFITQRLRRVLLLTDAGGRVLEVSELYNRLGIESPEEIRAQIARYNKDRSPIWRIRRAPDGTPFLIRTGVLTEGKTLYLCSIGRSLANDQRTVDQFTRNYYLLMPGLLIALSVAGWFVAGRALRPLNDVAHAARSITADNLSLHISQRGAGDELDHLIDSFNAMADRLESSITQIRRFSTDVSHELRTPLTAMRGELEVALFAAQTPEQYREAITAAIEDIDRLGKVVRALLQLSQAESGQVILVQEPVDLSALAGAIASDFTNAAEMEELRLASEIEPGCRVRGDRIQLERLLINLLSNAVKYTPSGGNILLRLRRAGAEVHLTVKDTGRGIAAEHLPHIFDRFYRIPDGHADPDRGLGLGLSFVAWIVKAHGGRIDVASTPGQGTEFSAAFPALPAVHSPAEPARQAVG